MGTKPYTIYLELSGPLGHKVSSNVIMIKLTESVNLEALKLRLGSVFDKCVDDLLFDGIVTLEDVL